MDIGVEISLYPFATGYASYIHELIERLRRHSGLKVESTSMSTQVFGQFEEVMAVLQAETRATFEYCEAHGHRAVLVMKLMGPLTPA